METNSKKVMAAMPSFDDFLGLAQQIKQIYLDRMLLENEIKSSESKAFTEVMNNPTYFVNGKPVPVSYYENCYKHRGLNGEILELRNKLAEKVAELELKRSQFEVYQRMHELFKTLVYQEKVNV